MTKLEPKDKSLSGGGAVVRAVIFDVYGTLLRVEAGPGEPEAEDRWRRLWKRTFSLEAPLSLAGFQAACRMGIAADHAIKKAVGVPWPEVDWRAITTAAAPRLASLNDEVLDDFLASHAALQRTCTAMPGALEFLAEIHQRGLPTGIASNAQAYTFHEMRSAGFPLGLLHGHGRSGGGPGGSTPEKTFAEDLCFWSFHEGFSKPDPGVFFKLAQRLATRGIQPQETLMIGDRLDNDILPARAAGWQAFHFQSVWPNLVTLNPVR